MSAQGRATGLQGQDKKRKREFERYQNKVIAAVADGIKMASPDVYNPACSPLRLLEVLKRLGSQSLTLAPETLMAVLDKEYGGWTSEKVAKALDYFHSTGFLKTDVPDLVRHKLYALRIIMTSDSAHHEWHIFEKIGSAFNDRTAHFGVMEPLTAIECARTVAIMDAVRPDAFTHEVKAYIAAACRTDGLYTVKPSKYLNMSEDLLEKMNREGAGRETDPRIVQAITDRMAELERDPKPAEDFISIQALRLIAINFAAHEAAAV